MQRYELIYTNKQGIVKTISLPESVLFNVIPEDIFKYRLFRHTLNPPSTSINSDDIIFDILDLNDFNRNCTNITLVYFNDSHRQELLSNVHFDNIIGSCSAELMNDNDILFVETLTMW